MTFEFATSQRIIFGNDSRFQLRELVEPLGQRVFLVGGSCLTNDGKVFDYLELIGEGRPLARATAPFVALPRGRGRVVARQ